MRPPRPEFDAIVLAGGRARRLGGSDKPAALVGGRRLLDVALDAVAGAGLVVVVGPARPVPPGILVTCEDPPYAGPVAAVAAGLTALSTAGSIASSADDLPVVVLASDLPALTARHVDDLRAALAETQAPAVFAVDGGGRRQHLLGIWRRSALDAVRQTGPNAAMRNLIPAGAAYVPMTGIDDVDTPEQLAAARRAAPTRAVDPVTARRRIAGGLTPLPEQILPAGTASGAVLARPLIAVAAFPPFDASAMDGYAVAGPPPWRIAGPARAAGQTGAVELLAGEAVAIATGAMLPRGADRVLRHEETARDGDVLTETSTGRDDTRRLGSAWPVGAALAPAGSTVDAAVRSVARAARVPDLTVRGPVRARLHTSGDEVVPGDADIPPGAVPDTASDPVAEILGDAGVRVTRAGHLADRPEIFEAAMTAPDTDVVVIVGATGHGVADHLRSVLAGAEADIVLDGLNLRPGGSLLLARLPVGRIVLGLGGNPLAAVAGTVVVLPALLDGLLGRTPARPEVITLNDDAARLPGRWRVLPVEPDGAGGWSATAGRGTGHLASMIGHRGLALVPPAGSPAGVERLR